MAFSARRFQGSKQLDAAARNSPPLSPEASGEAVEILQQALIDLGFKMPISTARSGLPDGIFGSETSRAVHAFQSRHRLVQDGVVGHATLARLDAIFALRDKAALVRMSAEAIAPPPVSPWFLS